LLWHQSKALLGINKILGEIMKQVQKNIALALVNLVLINSTLGIASVYAATSNSGALFNDVKTLRASIDSGSTTPTAAVDTFSAAISSQNVSIDDVNAFVKTQMNDEQFAVYQGRINTALRGIDPSTLKASEVGQIVGQAVSDVQTTGLYWNGCTDVWAGSALIAAAIVAGVFAIVKSKSAASIQSDYQARIAKQQAATAASVTQTQNQYSANITNTTDSYNKQISDTNSWQTAFPTDIGNEKNSITSSSLDSQSAQGSINNLKNEISSEQDTADQYQRAYDTETNQTQKNIDFSQLNSAEDTISSYQTKINSYNQQISSDNSDIASDQQAINNYQTKISIYTQDPGQAAIDAATLATTRDQAITDLQNAEPIAIQNIQTAGTQAVTDLQTTETQDVANVPSNQALATQLEIGGGIGAAIGAGLLIYGIKSGDCSSNN
jgi:hypothetical protein